MALMEIRNLDFTYPGATEPALRDVSLSVPEGSFIVLCGTTGSGKSTLLRHLKPELTPHGRRSGTMSYDGADIAALPPRVSAASVGFVMQDPDSQIVTDTVWHELAFGLENLGTDPGVIRRRVAEMASFFGIEGWFRRECSTLSSGQKQILALASVMAMQPRMLVLDEPTAQLDPIAALEFLQLLERIHRELGTTMVIAEHRLEETLPLADRAVVMDRGEILCEDIPARIGHALAAAAEGRQDSLRRMVAGLPAAMRVALASLAAGSALPMLPMTPRDGHAWLASRPRPEQDTVSQAAVPVPRGKGQGKACASLEAREIWFRYSREDPDVLRGLSLTIPAGEVHAVLGGNGTGKSTLLSLLCGLIRPRRGQVWVDGRATDTRKPRSDDGIVLLGSDPRALFVHETVREEIGSVAPPEAGSSEGILEAFGITALMNRHPMDLSSGERQKTALAMALLRNPRILMLDEPTRGLDPAARETLCSHLRGLATEGRTILMVTHDVEFAATAADSCSLLFDGEIVSSGTPAEFFAGNRFYTTAANRMAREWFPDIVTVEDILIRWNLTGRQSGPDQNGMLP